MEASRQPLPRGRAWRASPIRGIGRPETERERRGLEGASGTSMLSRSSPDAPTTAPSLAAGRGRSLSLHARLSSVNRRNRLGHAALAPIVGAAHPRRPHRPSHKTLFRVPGDRRESSVQMGAGCGGSTSTCRTRSPGNQGRSCPMGGAPSSSAWQRSRTPRGDPLIGPAPDAHAAFCLRPGERPSDRDLRE